MKKIGIDIRMIDNSGIGTTIRGLLDNLDHQQLKKVRLFGPANKPNPYPYCEYISVPYPIYSLGQHWNYADLLNNTQLSFFHMPHFDVPRFYKKPFVATIHDLIHILFPKFSTKPFSKFYAHTLIKFCSESARRILVVSENTKNDLVYRYPRAAGKIKVIYPGVDTKFKPIPNSRAQGVLSKYNLNPGYLLFVGNLRESKNIPRLIKSYQAYLDENVDGPPMVLVGKRSIKIKIYEKYKNKFVFLEGVPTDDLPSIYSQAHVFIFPSLYEGFGLPPLEAMACGTPVITSKVASLPEVCGRAAHYVDPYSPDDIKNGITAVLSSREIRSQMENAGVENARKFSWNRFASDTWEEYEKILYELGKEK